MNFETRYTATDVLQKKAAKQLFFTVFLGRKWIGLGAFWVVAGASVAVVPSSGWTIPCILFTAGFILTVMWVKTYFMLLRNSRDYLQMIDDPTMTLKIDDVDLEISASNGSRKTAWSKMDRIVETNDFLIPMIGKIPIICLPKSELTDETAAFVRQVIPNCRDDETSPRQCRS